MFWAAELNFRGALDYLRGFDQVDNQMGGLYHWFQGQKCSRSAHLELIWEIPVKITMPFDRLRVSGKRERLIFPAMTFLHRSA